MKQKQIQLTIGLDEENVAESIHWQATDAPRPEPQACEAVLLSLWDAEARSTLRIDLWTKKMEVEHMNAFVFQTLMTLADTYQSATNNEQAADALRRFGEEFGKNVPLPRPAPGEG